MPQSALYPTIRAGREQEETEYEKASFQHPCHDAARAAHGDHTRAGVYADRLPAARAVQRVLPRGAGVHRRGGHGAGRGRVPWSGVRPDELRQRAQRRLGHGRGAAVGQPGGILRAVRGGPRAHGPVRGPDLPRAQPADRAQPCQLCDGGGLRAAAQHGVLHGPDVPDLLQLRVCAESGRHDRRGQPDPVRAGGGRRAGPD